MGRRNAGWATNSIHGILDVHHAMPPFFLVPVSLHRMGMVFFVLLGGERTEFGFISWFDLCKYCPS